MQYYWSQRKACCSKLKQSRRVMSTNLRWKPIFRMKFLPFTGYICTLHVHWIFLPKLGMANSHSLARSSHITPCYQVGRVKHVLPPRNMNPTTTSFQTAANATSLDSSTHLEENTNRLVHIHCHEVGWERVIIPTQRKRGQLCSLGLAAMDVF